MGVCFTVLQKTKQNKKQTSEGVQKCAAFAILIPHLSEISFYLFLTHKENILVSGVLIVSSRIIFYLHFYMRTARETFSGVTSVNLRCLSNNERKHTHAAIVINKLCTSTYLFIVNSNYVWLNVEKQ